VVAVFELIVGGVSLRFEREVVYRYGDQAYGEIRRPLRVVPRLEIAVEPRQLLWPTGVSGGSAAADATSRGELEVVLRSNVEEPLEGNVRVLLPAGWTVEGERRFRIGEPRGSVARIVKVEPPKGTRSGRWRIGLEAVLEGGEVARLALPVIEYEHIRPTAVPRVADIAVSLVDLELPNVRRVGYIPGASDRVPGILAGIGLPIDVLSAAHLARGELDRFDAIIVGSRAYEIDTALRRNNGRLLDYVRRGGTLLVQYQQYQFVRGGFAPYPIEIARPHGRVTDETAPIRLLEPGHRAFGVPNRIREIDWSGWVQERGLYFASSWDERYKPLLAMGDSGREEERGALLVAEIGKGRYIYTGLSFFRQLPAGVPGAIRLFVNLLN
jgi:hypothetical protein